MKKRRINFKNVLLFLILILALIFVGVFFVFQKEFNQKVKKDFNTVDHSDGKISSQDKDRLNILILGMEGTRTDMIMLGTFDPKSKTLNFISIPRDTYVENSYKDPTLKKINSVYEIPTQKGGVERLAGEVSKLLGIAVHDYVMINYDSVAKITDAVGGVDINIPFNMYYDDPYSKPPLHVYFEKGTAHLDGSNAIKYLRWRKNNDGSYGQEGDEGRIKRHQVFIKKMLEKALNPSTLPKTIEVAFENVETSLELSQVMGLVKDALSMPKENIKFYQEIGTPSYFNGLWYYLADKDKTQKLMHKIINNSIITDDDLNPSREFEQEALARGNDSNYKKRQEIEEEQEEIVQPSKKTVEDIKAEDIIFSQENTPNNQSQETQTTDNTNATDNNTNSNQSESAFNQEKTTEQTTTQETQTTESEKQNTEQSPVVETQGEQNQDAAPIF